MKIQQSRSLLSDRELSMAWCLLVLFLPWSVTSLSSNSEISHATAKGIGPKDGATDSHIFSPRMNYEEWTPLGKGDPLKNNPTFDYVPPVLDQVQYWVEPRETTETSAAATATAKRDILVLGVTAKRTSPKIPERVLQLIDGPKLGKNQHNGEHYTKSFTGSTGAELPKFVRATNFRYTSPNFYPSQTTKVQFQTMPVKSLSQPSLHYAPETSGNKLTGISHQTIDATIADGGPLRPPRIPQFGGAGISSPTAERFAITTPVPRRGPYLSQLSQPYQTEKQRVGGGSSAVASSLSNSYYARDPIENKRNAMTSVSLEKSNLIYQSTQTISGGWLVNTVSDLPDPPIHRPSFVGQSSEEQVHPFDQYENDHHVAASSNHQVRVLGHVGQGGEGSQSGQVHDHTHRTAIDASHSNNLTEVFVESTMSNANDSLNLSAKDNIDVAKETNKTTKEEDASKKNEKCHPAEEERTKVGEQVLEHVSSDKMHIVVANSTSQNHPPEEDYEAGRTSPVAIVMATKYRADGAETFPTIGPTVPPAITGSPSSSGSPIVSLSEEATAITSSIVPPTEMVPPSSPPISFSSTSGAATLPPRLTATSTSPPFPQSLGASFNSQDMSNYGTRYSTNTMNLVPPGQSSGPPQPAHRLPMKIHSLPASSSLSPPPPPPSRHPSSLYSHSNPNPNPNLHSYLHSPSYSHSHMHSQPHSHSQSHSHMHQQSPQHYLVSQMQPHSRLPGPISLHFNSGMHPAGPLRPAPAIQSTIASSTAMMPPQSATMMGIVPKPLSMPMLMSISMGHVSPPMAHVHGAGPPPLKTIPPIRVALGSESSEIQPSPPQDPSDSAAAATVIKAVTRQPPSGAQSPIYSALPPSPWPVIPTSQPVGVASSSSGDSQADFRFPLIATTNTPESSKLEGAIDDRSQSQRIDQSVAGAWNRSSSENASGINPGINRDNAQNQVEMTGVNRLEEINNETITPLRMRETTTTASLTTDPIFSHYKQPAKPIRGPMYLIIQGHSKVKTYKPSWVDKKSNNVPGLPGESNEIGGNLKANANEREYLSNLDRYVRNNTKKRTVESANLPETGVTKVEEKMRTTRPIAENKASSLMALVERGFDLDSSARLPISSGSSSETGGPTSPTFTVT